MSRIGIIINNIGSPSSPEPKDVGRYLKEFLMDKEILTIPFIIRYILVNWIIVPRRRFASSDKYKKVWGKKKSPLLEISELFAEKLQLLLKDQFIVKLGMRYAEPSIENALVELKAEGVKKIIFIPMYPQYARATNFSAEEKVKSLISTIFEQPIDLKIVHPFYKFESFIDLSAQKLNTEWASKKWQHILFSFHGLPASQVKKNEGCLVSENCCDRPQACALNCYRAQSVATAKAIAQKLNLTKDQYTICFQSRLGPAKWIGPASIDVVKKMAEGGTKNVLVQSPSFVADCLETLEEIALELKAEFQNHGGEDLKLISCLNDDKEWVEAFAQLISKQA